MIKKLPSLSALVLMLVVILLMAPTCQCGQGAQQSSAPPGPPQVASFKIVNENVAPGDLPLFTWEAVNASAVTITQDGEEVFRIEAVPDSGAGASFNSLQSRVLASTVDEGEASQPYSPGIYQVGFKGASNGKPSKMISGFGDNFTVQASAEIKALSDDGLVTATRVTFFNFVADGQVSSPPQIAVPLCANPGSSQPTIPTINNWSVKNSEIDEGTPPEFEFNVANAAIISIKQGGEFISFVQINNPPLVTSGISLPSLAGEAHASTTGEYEMKQPYSPGVYPVIYQGSSSGRPQTIALGPGENFTTDFAEITVCSPTGHTATARVNFNIVRRGLVTCVAPCECLTEAEAKAKQYAYKCSDTPCWKQRAGPYGSSLKMAFENMAVKRDAFSYNYKYCFRECPQGCTCLTWEEGLQRGFSGEDVCHIISPFCGGKLAGYCFPERTPPPEPLSITFTASRNVVDPMDPVTLTWDVTPCDNMTVKLVSDGIERTVHPSGSENIIAVKSACHYITADCQGIRGVKSQCITVQTPGMQIPPDRPPMYPPISPLVEPPCPPTDGPPLAPPSVPPTQPPPAT